MDKSPDAFRTISEVAEHLETPAHVLRFWESRFPQIKPVKRAGGRRYYRPSDVSLLTGIKRLLHDEGMTIRGVQKILREQGVRHVAGLSGDMAADDSADDAPFVDHVPDGAVRPSAAPIPFRSAPGLADAMAKALDHGLAKSEHPSAPSTPLPLAEPGEETTPHFLPDPGLADEPAQGTLLLTPSAPFDSAPSDASKDAAPKVLVDAAQDAEGASDWDEDIAAFVQAAQNDNAASSDVSLAAFPESQMGGGDFDEDDFDDAPTITLATRIRALPAGASVSKVGEELVAVVARLQALRDAMADASDSRRA